MPLVLLTALLLGSPPSIGDPRHRGGSRDLSDDDEQDPDAAFDEVGPRTFLLRAPPGRRVAAVAVAPNGRYTAYALEQAQGYRLAIVDTASTTLRALGPTWAAAPSHLALGGSRVAWVEGGALAHQAWWAAEDAATAARRPDEDAAHRVRTDLEGATPDALAFGPQGRVVLTVHRGGEGAALWTSTTNRSDRHKIAGADECPALVASGSDEVWQLLCHTREGWRVLHFDLGGEAPRVLREVELEAPHADARPVAVGATPLHQPVVLWQWAGRGQIAGWDDEERPFTLDLDFAPARLVVHAPHLVVAGTQGRVMVLASDGGSRLEVEGPRFGQPAGPPPGLSADGQVAVFAADARHPEHRQAKLIVVPALR